MKGETGIKRSGEKRWKRGFEFSKDGIVVEGSITMGKRIEEDFLLYGYRNGDI